MDSIAILGAGGWGTALAVHLARVGHDVRLWARDDKLVEEMRARRINSRYLPDLELPDRVTPESRYEAALDGAKLVVFAVPSHGLRAIAERRGRRHPAGCGRRQRDEGARERDAAADVDGARGGDRIGTFRSSCSRARASPPRSARSLPTAVLSASRSATAAAYVQDRFKGPAFRIYVSDDVAGVEIGGATKNVIAIAAGAVEGLGLGHNAMAALITRGLAEISRLAEAEGGRRETVAGLSGLGDLVLTSTGHLSRNRHVGCELGRGRSLNDILGSMRMVAEGVRTTAAALALGQRHGIELPITAEMAAVLEGRRQPAEAVDALMGRRQRAEKD